MGSAVPALAASGDSLSSQPSFFESVIADISGGFGVLASSALHFITGGYASTEMPSAPRDLTAAVGSAGSTSTKNSPISNGTNTNAGNSGTNAVSNPSLKIDKLGINVPLVLSKALSVAQTASFSQVVTAALSVSGPTTFESALAARGTETVNGLLNAYGGITTNGADVNLGGGKIYASNIINAIHAGSGVTISGTPSDPIISVQPQSQSMPIFYGGGGGGGSSGVTSVSGSGGLSGHITDSGSLSLDLAHVNDWTGLQSFSAGASTTDLTITSATGTILKTDASGKIVPAIPGVDYLTSAISALWSENTTTSALSYEAGNVGIGTSSPNTRLSVAGDTYLGGDLAATGTVHFARALGVASGGTGTSTAPSFGQLLLGNVSGGYDLVATSSLGISGTWSAANGNAYYTAGNVGIGTTSPGTTLSVAGDTYLGGNLIATGTATTSNLSITNATSSLLKTNALGQVASAVAGTDYVAPSALQSYLALSNWYATTTDALKEGVNNLYWTSARGTQNFETNLAATTTDALAEGTTNKYYTDARVGSYITSSTTLPSFLNFWQKSGTNLSYTIGNVGIGTTTPSTKLAVSGSGYFSDALTAVNTFSAGTYSVTGVGTTWIDRTGAGSGNWYAMGMSSDSKVIVAAANTGFVYVSTDGGITWAKTSLPSSNWYTAAVSGDGTHMAVAPDGGYIYTSSDSGLTWTKQTTSTSQRWRGIAISADGTKMAALAYFNGVFTSTNGGISWINRTGSGAMNGYAWTSIASSADGTKLVASAKGGSIWTSTNSGVSWTNRNVGGQWMSVTSSSDGTKLAAVATSGDVYTSTDSGVTWVPKAGSGSASRNSIASSADGSVLITATVSGQIQISKDSGLTWTASARSGAWYTVTVSSDGTKFATADDGGDIWTYDDSGVTNYAALSVSSNRNVGIGLSVAAAYKLDVDGFINTDGTSGGYKIDGQTILQASSTNQSTMVGDGAGAAFTASSSKNVALGYHALAAATSSNNVALGAFAGSNLTWGGGNIMIGANVSAPDASGSGQLNLGNVLYGSGLYNGSTSTSTPAATGKIGIGTTTPWKAFSVNGDFALTGAIFDHNASAGLSGYVLQSTGSGVAWVATSSLGISSSGGGGSSGGTSSFGYPFPSNATSTKLSFTGGLSTTNASTTQIGSTGNAYLATAGGAVGIGTTSPSATFAVSGDTFLGGNLTVTGNLSLGNFNEDATVTCGNPYHTFIGPVGTVGGDECAALNVTQEDMNGNIIYRFGAANGTWAGEFYANSTLVGLNTKSSVPLVFEINGNEKARVNSNGNFGIATTSPWKTLSVNGDLALTGAIFDHNASSGLSGYVLQSTGTGVAWVATSTLGLSGSSGISAPWTKSGSNVFFDGGNVGIGTNSPADTLSVVGTGSFSGALSADTLNAGITTSKSSLTWSELAVLGNAAWTSAAASSDGTRLVVANYGGYIYTSADGGTTWTQRTSAGSKNWNSITSSADGMKLAAAVYRGDIYTSTDGGATWTDRTSLGSSTWNSIASSADGMKLAAASNGDIYTSTDGGATWTARTSAGARQWYGITSSSDGMKLAAVANNGYIYTSTDGGATWTAQNTVLGNQLWYAITSTSDGTELAAVEYPGYVYVSTNSGASWQVTGAGNRQWRGIAFSGDGSELVAGAYNGNLYVSTNLGANWAVQSAPGSSAWQTIAVSTDGSRILAVPNSGYVWMGTINISHNYMLSVTNTNVGIATSTPWKTLSVNGDLSLTGGLFDHNSSAGLSGYILQSTGTSLAWVATTTLGITAPWTKVGSNIYYSGGSVGIGTNKPSDTLSVVGTGSFTGALSAGTLKAGSYSGTSGLTWTKETAAGSGTWVSTALSSDGTSIAATNYGGYIYTSSDGGATWTQRTSAGSRNWYSITSSADGTKLAAVTYSGDYIYTSTDGGATWTTQTSSGAHSWRSVTSSSDGTNLAAAASSDYIYTSTDGGATWTQRTSAGTGSWNAITSSADGTKLAAVVQSGYIYTSTDGGASWVEHTGPGALNWWAITSSADGTKLAAAVDNGYIYTSIDGGTTWIQRTSAGSRGWRGISCSSDCSVIAAAEYNGLVYVSTDGGATWTSQSVPSTAGWEGITVSSDGSTIAVPSDPGYIWVSKTTVTQKYTLTVTNDHKVGVGTSSPSSQLTVWGTDAAASTSAFAVVNSASTTAFAVYDNGNATYSGSIFQSSDHRLKTDIMPLDASSSLAAIMRLTPVSYLRIDQPEGGENLGFIAQAVQAIFPNLVSTTSPTSLTPGGTLTLNYVGLIAPLVRSVQAIENTVTGLASSITSKIGNFGTVHTDKLCVGDTCVDQAQLAALLASAGEKGTSSDSTSTATAVSTPPIITLSGANPAHVALGASYVDPGATITGPAGDTSLGIHVSVDGGASTTPDQISLDTSAAGTHTILFFATDQNGLTGSATRTVIVGEATSTATTTPPEEDTPQEDTQQTDTSTSTPPVDQEEIDDANTNATSTDATSTPPVINTSNQATSTATSTQSK